MTDTVTVPTIEPTQGASDVDGWWQELNDLDVAAYAAIAATPTPVVDRVFRVATRAADDREHLGEPSGAAVTTVESVDGRAGTRTGHRDQDAGSATGSTGAARGGVG